MAISNKKVKPNWIVILFVTLTDASSRLRQKLWRWVYDKIASRDKTGKFVFMNYGYNDNTEHQPLALKPEDEPFRYLFSYTTVLSVISTCKIKTFWR